MFLYKVQSKVSLKYDSWHKEVLSKFGSLLGNEMVDFHSAISKVNMHLFVMHELKNSGNQFCRISNNSNSKVHFVQIV